MALVPSVAQCYDIRMELASYTKTERDSFTAREAAVWAAAYVENWGVNFRENIADGNSLDTALRNFRYGYLSCIVADSAVRDMRHEESKVK